MFGYVPITALPLPSPITRVNEKDIVIDSLTIFNRLVFASERESTLEESLQYELTAMPMSLFNNEQMMRKANKAALGLGQYLKNVVDCNVTSSKSSSPSIIDGGWLLYQVTSFTGFETYGDIANAYLRLVPKPEQRKVIVVFDGYARSTKDHEHQRRIKAYCSDIAIKSTTVCTVPMKKLFSNSKNKHELIMLLSNVFTEHGIEVHVATDDADTMVANKTLNLSLNEDVEVKAEDTDILCLLVHHFTENHNEIVMTTRNGSHSISKIVNALDANIKRILLFVHSFSGCDTVSSIHGFGKVKILKKAVSFHEEGHLASLLSVRVSTNEVIEAGLSLFQHIYGDKTKALETLRFLSYSRMIAKKKLNPSRLPPATSSATEHILRSYLQYHNWVTLDTASLNPLYYGWEMSSEGYYRPIPTKAAIAPAGMLNLICCNCSVEVENPCQYLRCSCRKYGFKCLPACGQCHGSSCTNAPERQEDSGESNNSEEMG